MSLVSQLYEELDTAQAERDELRAQVEALRDLAAECSEYLSTNSMTSIGSGSILHRKLADAALQAKP